MLTPGGAVRLVNVLAMKIGAYAHGHLGRHRELSAFVAPEPRAERVHMAAIRSEQAQPQAPRRYTGRAGSRRRFDTEGPRPDPQAPRPRPVPAPSADEPSTPARPPNHSRVVPQVWSLRLLIVTAIMCAVLVAWRAIGLFTPAVDMGAGTEATTAAYVATLTGHVVPVGGAARLLPPVAPWNGAAPYDAAAGLPLHAWLTCALIGLLGDGVWAGRAAAIAFSVLAGILLFAVVRRTCGTRAGLYALLFFALAPLSVTLGQQYSSASAILASQAAALLALVYWRERAGLPGSALAWAAAIGTAVLAGLLDPAAVFLAVPAAYLMLYEPARRDEPVRGRKRSAAFERVSMSLGRAYRGKLAGYVAALVGSSALWWAFTQGFRENFTLGAEDRGGLAAAIGSLLDASTYVQFLGMSIERLLAVSGILFVLAGLLKGTHPPFKHVLHVWLVAGAAHVLFDGARLPAHEDVLLPVILPACALAGVGAAWAGSLPSRMWSIVNKQADDRGVRYVVSPHTSWLFDVPEARADAPPAARPQARPALGRAVARRTETQILRLRRAGLIAIGHVGVLAVIGYVSMSGAAATYARLQPSVRGVELAEAGAEVAAATPPGSLLVIAGPNAAELFASSGRSGWAVREEDFNLPELQTLQRKGATYLVSADRQWLGQHADYRGLITNYAVARLSRNFILFDLSSKPAASDRLYFLESGHTLGGAFRRFWEQNGGVNRLGYPISEEVQEPNPLDGVTRAVQYFERAVLELHPEERSAGAQVMLAAVGRWVTRGREFPRVRALKQTTDRWYFADTGHSVKQAFLRYWQREGGVAVFGYPISEEMPEINASDGKVYTVQYFERARLEWHPTDAGTVNEVQLGLIGKQALEMYSR